MQHLTPTKILKVGLLIAFMIVAFGVVRIAFPPVRILINFDTDTQIVSVTLKNESARNITFVDRLTLPHPEGGSFKNIPGGLSVRSFTKVGNTLVKTTGENDPDYITIMNMDSSIGSLPVDISQLMPHQTITAKVSLIDLVGNWGPYKSLFMINNLCVQFKARIFFNGYLLFPVEKESDVFCLDKGMKVAK